jgi:hypothetical protein
MISPEKSGKVSADECVEVGRLESILLPAMSLYSEEGAWLLKGGFTRLDSQLLEF